MTNPIAERGVAPEPGVPRVRVERPTCGRPTGPADSASPVSIRTLAEDLCALVIVGCLLAVAWLLGEVLTFGHTWR